MACEWRSARHAPVRSATRDAGELANATLHAIGDSDLRRAVEACAVVRRANRALISAILETEQPIPLSLLEAVEALPFATRGAGRSGRWRHMADLLHLLEPPALHDASFPTEEEAAA